MKHKVGAIVFSILSVIMISGTATSINSGAEGIPPLIIITMLMVGLAIFNIVCVARSSSTGMVDKATGKKIRFAPTVQTKGIILDDTHKLWQTRFTATPQTFHYSDLRSYEIIRENSHTTTGNYQRTGTLLGTQGHSTRSSSTRMSYISLEIKLVNMQRLRWVPRIGYTDSHKILADVEDTAELLEHIIQENRQNNR